MMFSTRSLLPILAALCALLGGCVETRFESPIGDNIETCDVAWKGLWTNGKAANDDPGAFYVDDECHFVVLEQPEKKGPLKQVHIPLNYVHSDGKDYLVIAQTALKGIAEVRPLYGVTPVPDKAFFFARYRIHGDRLDLYSVDNERTAKLIIDGKLDGTVSKVGNELHVFVRGDRTRMLEIVRTQPIFSDKAEPSLQHSRQTLTEYERDLIAAQRKASP